MTRKLNRVRRAVEATILQSTAAPNAALPVEKLMEFGAAAVGEFDRLNREAKDLTCN